MTEHGEVGNQVPAGWYSDPLGRGRERYWDGGAWSDDVRPAQPAALPDLPPPTVRTSPEPDVQPGQSGQWPPAGAQPGQWPDGAAQPTEPQGWPQPRTTWPAAQPVRPGQPRPASVGRRVLACLLDAVVCNAVGYAATWSVWGPSVAKLQDYLLDHPGANFNELMQQSEATMTTGALLTVVLGWFVVSLIYGTVFLAWRGGTPGMLIARLRVVPTDEPERRKGLPAGRALVRSLLWSAGAQWPWQLPLVILYAFCVIPVATTAKRQGLHDRLARTLVVDRSAGARELSR